MPNHAEKIGKRETEVKIAQVEFSFKGIVSQDIGVLL
jgi:5-methylthioribose kinase